MSSVILFCGLGTFWLLFFVGIMWKCILYSRESRERVERLNQIAQVGYLDENSYKEFVQ